MDNRDSLMANTAGLEFYTVEEVAGLARMSPNAIYNLVARKALPAIRLGRTIRLPKDACNRIFRGEAA